MTSTEDIRPAPARARSDLDRLYAALPVDVDVPLARVVEASGLDREVVRGALACAALGGVAAGLNGRWCRRAVSRTKFRDGCVFGAIRRKEHGTLPTLVDLAAALPASRPQLYTSLARLQAAGSVWHVRDGSRTPTYDAL